MKTVERRTDRANRRNGIAAGRALVAVLAISLTACWSLASPENKNNNANQNTNVVPTCGNGIIDPYEQCDGSNFGGATCADYLPNTTGTLLCNSASCTVDLSNCQGVCNSNGICEEARGENTGNCPQDCPEVSTPCTIGPECASTHCVDGVCCNTTCTGTCQACNIAGSVGTCTNYTAQTDPAGECGLCKVCSAGACVNATTGTDPKDQCTQNTQSTCGQDGECNGSGACRLYSASTVCAAQSCTGSTLYSQDLCNGTGICVDGGSQACPGNYSCLSGTSCRTTCTAPAHCRSGYACSGGSCVSTSLTWVAIAGGTYDMGSATIGSTTQPVHSVTVPGLELTQTEVTVTQYGACVTAGSCTAPVTGGSCNWGVTGYENHPVNCVSWHRSVSYCVWAGGRLPTESEWEYAARSRGQAIDYPWGNETATCSYAVMWDGSSSGCGTGRTWAVCGKTAGNTSQGLCDMAGNVWEWVEDDWHDSYTGAPNDGTAWIDNPRGSLRVFRGGSFGDLAGNLRAAYRHDAPPSGQNYYIGFRCARVAP